MRLDAGGALARYGVALVAAGAATGLRLLLAPLLGREAPYAAQYLGVLLAAAYGGAGPGLLATALGGLGVARLVLPAGGGAETTAPQQVGLLMYLVVAGCIALMGGALRARRREAEAAALLAARQSGELRTTLASIGDAVIVTDVAGRITSLNHTAEALTGFSADEARGRPLDEVFRVVDEDSRTPVASPVARALAEGAVVGLANHTLLIARDGSLRPIDDSAAPIGGSRAPLGVVLVFRDVSERRAAEEAAARLAAIVAGSDYAIVGKTLDGTIVSWNEGAERLYGYTAQEALGRSIELVVPPERMDELRARLARVRRGEPRDHFETVRRRKDGRPVDVSVNISPIRNERGEVIGASTIARDVGEQKRVAERLRQSEQELSDFFEHAAIGLRWVGPDGVVLRANQAMLEIVGCAREEYVGRPLRDFDVDPEDGAQLWRRLQAGEHVRDHPARLRTRDGGIRDVLIDSSARWEGGHLVHTRCFVRDVTERRHAEERLRNSERLYRAIGESIDYGVWICDPHGRNVYASDSFLRLVGLTQEQCASFGWAEALHPDDVERTLQPGRPASPPARPGTGRAASAARTAHGIRSSRAACRCATSAGRSWPGPASASTSAASSARRSSCASRTG